MQKGLMATPSALSAFLDVWRVKFWVWFVFGCEEGNGAFVGLHSKIHIVVAFYLMDCVRERRSKFKKKGQHFGMWCCACLFNFISNGVLE